MSNTQNFVKIRTRDLAVLICMTSLLWGILHCIKSQLFFGPKQCLAFCGLDGGFFGNERI